MKICIVTSYSAAAEPRAPRHAIAAKRAFPNARVVLVDMAPEAQMRGSDPAGLRRVEVERRTLEFPTRSSGLIRLAARKMRVRASRLLFATTGAITESLFGDRVSGLTKVLKEIGADVFIAHNIETLLPAVQAAKATQAAVIFDCMEYYSDMGEAQSPLEARASSLLEAQCLPACRLVIASSDKLADALAREYHLRRPLPAYNVPPIVNDLPARRGDGLNLYWRNSVVGFGQRGLDDALVALSRLPSDVRLFLQGRAQADGGSEVATRIEELGLVGRVTVLPPYVPEDAVREAAAHDVGLCLERKGPRNHDLTVSNKMFDYHMAALAVVSSDLPSLGEVVKRSRGGLLYQAGSPQSLVEAILQLRSAPELLARLQTNARRFALEEANLEIELDKLVSALQTTFYAIHPETSATS